MRFAILLLAFAVACGGEPRKEPGKPREKKLSEQPRKVVFEHILISFRGAHEIVDARRTRAEAKDLAESIHDRVLSGVDFEALKQEYSDDRNKKSGRALGPYTILNYGVRRTEMYELPRENYARLPAHLLFNLEVGEVALAAHHAADCPFGWHVLKRVE